MEKENKDTAKENQQSGVTVNENVESGSARELFTEQNVKIAKDKTVKLFDILSKARQKNGGDVKNLQYTKDEVVRYTNLSHKEASRLLDTLQTFGCIVFTNQQKRQFMFNNTTKDVLHTILTQALIEAEYLHYSLYRYRKIVEASSEIAELAKSRLVEDVENMIAKKIEFTRLECEITKEDGK